MTLKKNIHVLPPVQPENRSILSHDHNHDQDSANLRPPLPNPNHCIHNHLPPDILITSQDSPTVTVISASHGHAVSLKAGTNFRLIDLHGLQVIDMTAFCLPFPSSTGISSAEHLSASYTRFHTNGQPITIGESIYTNMDEPLFRLVGDTVKTHDMTFMSCFPKLYTDRGIQGHRSCASNMVEALKEFGMKSLTEVRDPFNVFQNTPGYTLKPLNTSKKGDWCEFEVERDCVLGLSCCPFDLDGFNGGVVTDVAVVTGLKSGMKGAVSNWHMDGETERRIYGVGGVGGR